MDKSSYAFIEAAQVDLILHKTSKNLLPNFRVFQESVAPSDSFTHQKHEIRHPIKFTVKFHAKLKLFSTTRKTASPTPTTVTEKKHSHVVQLLQQSLLTIMFECLSFTVSDHAYRTIIL